VANKSRDTREGSPTYDEFTLHLSSLEMLKIERLLKIAEGASTFYSSAELQWLSNAKELFTVELPSGGYEI
jgi:hypothetical protein